MKSEQTDRCDPAIVAVGQQIRLKRQKHGISQERLAAAVGIARSYYGEIERGQRNISSLYMMRIAATLKIEVGDLFPRREAFEPLLQNAGELEVI